MEYKFKIISEGMLRRTMVKWDGVRFALIEYDKETGDTESIIVLNPAEMLKLINFAGTLGEGD